MTMTDKRCDVCQRDPVIYPAIGVASTSMPMSVAFCYQCVKKGADPIVVFECWYDDIGDPDLHAAPDHCVTFCNGKYMTYREWYAIRSLQHDCHVRDWFANQMEMSYPNEPNR